MATLRLQGEGGYHPRKQTSNPRHPSVDFYHSPVAVWVNSAPQPKRWGPRAHRGISKQEKGFYFSFVWEEFSGNFVAIYINNAHVTWHKRYLIHMMLIRFHTAFPHARTTDLSRKKKHRKKYKMYPFDTIWTTIFSVAQNCMCWTCVHLILFYDFSNILTTPIHRCQSPRFYQLTTECIFWQACNDDIITP